MPNVHPTDVTKAAQPQRTFFDPWNSSATGHQRAENRLSGSTGWRDSRTAKLAEQFKDGQRGGKRMYDTVGAGSENFGTDGRLENGGWAVGVSGLRKGGQQSLWDSFRGGKKDHGTVRGKDVETSTVTEDTLDKSLATSHHALSPTSDDTIKEKQTPSPKKQIFRGLVIYINGSTYPLVSDYKLKQLLAEHGARLSIALGRRQVTHVILGTPNKNGTGAGGGLASSKIQKEIATVRGAGVKFVGVEWVLESLKAGKRLPEARFSNLKLASKGQGSVFKVFGGGTDA